MCSGTINYLTMFFIFFLERNYLWFIDDGGNDKIHADEQHQERNENRNLKN
jgi:hypothetical protein